MKYIDENGKKIQENSRQDLLLEKIYTSPLGRGIMKLFVNPFFSMAMGKLLDSRCSACLIKPFIKMTHINLKEYEVQKYSSYNEFFTRQIRKEFRPIEHESKNLITPADGKLSVYKVTERGLFTVKHTKYSLDQLLKNPTLAQQYQGGYAVIVRLTVDNYHRYCYVDNGLKGKNHKIAGKLHTVNPIANEYVPIYKENSREYCRIKTENFGEVIQMEVGAMMVGKIKNYKETGQVKRGEEKGKFEFGGSTVILLLKKGRVSIEENLLKNTSNGYETKVKMGQKIGTAI